MWGLSIYIYMLPISEILLFLPVEMEFRDVSLGHKWTFWLERCAFKTTLRAEGVKLQISQFSQALLQAFNVRLSLFCLVAEGTALQELHPHRQLAELKVLAFSAQKHATANGAVLGAESS